MRFFFRLLALSIACWSAYVLWAVQPDRQLMEELEREIEDAGFSAVERILSQYGFTSEVWTYDTSTNRLAR